MREGGSVYINGNLGGERPYQFLGLSEKKKVTFNTRHISRGGFRVVKLFMRCLLLTFVQDRNKIQGYNMHLKCTKFMHFCTKKTGVCALP